jgi:hypothetical protein
MSRFSRQNLGLVLIGHVQLPGQFLNFLVLLNLEQANLANFATIPVPLTSIGPSHRAT